MTPDDVRAAAEQLVDFHEGFAPLFGMRQAQDHAFDYINGLMTCPERKSVEPIALLVGHGDVSGLQKFLNSAPWDRDDVQDEIQGVFARRLAPSAAGTAVGVVGVLDESCFSKKGRHSAGVAGQHNGRLDKTDNCQVGVFLVAVAPAGVALLDHQLYLPESWCGDAAVTVARRETARVPEGAAFGTKPEIAAAPIHNVAVTGEVGLDWVTADSAYGKNGPLMTGLEASGQRYVMETTSCVTVWARDPAGRTGRDREAPTVAAVAGTIPDGGRLRLAVRAGAKGPLVLEFAAVRAWAVRDRRPGPPIWLLVRRSTGPDPEVKYFVSNAPADTPLEVLAEVACARHRVEEFFEDAKSYLGMAQYETRSYVGWHHHMTLVAVAHLFITLMRAALKKNSRS
jgi:SRSO17 transposase